MSVEGQPLLELPETPREELPAVEVPRADVAPENEDLQEAEKAETEIVGDAPNTGAETEPKKEFRDPTRELQSVEAFVTGLQEWVRKQADSVSQEQDLSVAKEQLEDLMQEVVIAQEKLESAAHQALALQRDLALATDRSLVLRAEEQEHSGAVEKKQLIVAANAHLRQCLCRDPAGKLWPIWSTKASDLQEYGPGISLYFNFTVRLGITFFLCSILVLPLLLLSLVGNGLDNIDAGTGELGVSRLFRSASFLTRKKI
ncbi:unnamed protein product [Symbiodinium sp. CCMP2456]|nr:unnamed protein product [Symbiodinium sp. CCMP2456]